MTMLPGRVAQSVGHLTRKSGVLGSIPGLATYFHFSFSFFKKGSCQLLAYVHEVLVNRLGGLSLPRKSVVRLTDRPNMTLDVYRGRKTTMQQQIMTMLNAQNPEMSHQCYKVTVKKTLSGAPSQQQTPSGR